MKYKNIIWDWNGTILNDAPVAFEATNILLERFGYPTITLGYYRDNVDTPIVNFYSKIFDLNKHDMQMLDDEWGVLYNQLSDKIELHADIKEMLSTFADKTTLIRLFFRLLKRMRLRNMPVSFLSSTILMIFSEHRILKWRVKPFVAEDI